MKTVKKIMTKGFLSFVKFIITRPSANAILFDLSYNEKAMKKTSIFISIGCLLLATQMVWALDVQRTFDAGRFDMSLDASYFKSESNYGANGDKQSLSSGSRFQDIQLATSARYVWFNKLGTYSGLDFGNVESANTTNTRTNSILTNILLGADYQFLRADNWSLYADFAYFHANEKIDVDGDTALASDGASQFRAQVTALIQLSQFRNFASLGYNHRTEGLSALMLYSLGSEYMFNQFSIGAEVRGLSSVKDDDQTNNPLYRENLTNKVNAGSKKYFTINPNLLEAMAIVSYSVNTDLKLKLSLGSTVTGSNSAEGIFVKTSFYWGFGSGGRSNRKAAPQIDNIENRTSLSDDDPGFKIETNDGVDQNLFKPSQPVKLKK